MDYVQQEKMRRACDKFVEQVDPVELMPYLPSLNQWSREMVGAKRNQEGPSEAAQVLHGFLLKRPIFEELLAALRHPSVGRNHLADLIDAPAPDVSAGCCNTKLRPQATETVATLSASSAASSRQPHLGTSQTCCITTPWIELPASVKPAIRKFDIGNPLRTYDDLAGILDFTIEEVDSIKHNVPQGESKTLAFIEHWNQRNPINLGDLLRVFHALDRVDIVTELENKTGVKYESRANALDGAPVGELAAGRRSNLELQRNGYLADNQRSTMKVNTYYKDADKKFNDKKLSLPTSRKEENISMKHNTKNPSNPLLFHDEETSVKTYCNNSENVAANIKEKLLVKSFTSRPALKPDNNKNEPKVTQNSIDSCSSVRGETEIVHETINDEISTDSNRSTETENCSLASVVNLEKCEFEINMFNAENINDERLVHEQYKVRKLEIRLESEQKISDLILQNDLSSGPFSTDVGAIARKDGCKQLDVTNTTQYEDYSLEDERAFAPKIPSITQEQESITKKAEAPFPSHLLLSDWKNETALNSEESFQIDEESVVSTDGEIPVVDEGSLHHLTIQRSHVTEFPVKPHCLQTEECGTGFDGNISIKETIPEKLNTDCKTFRENSPNKNSEFLANSSNVKMLDTFQNTGKLDEGNTNVSGDIIQLDKALFAGQINDANVATNSVSAANAKGYGNTGLRHNIVRGLCLTGLQALTSQECACSKEHAISKSCLTDIGKSQYYRMSIFKVIKISYDSMI